MNRGHLPPTSPQTERRGRAAPGEAGAWQKRKPVLGKTCCIVVLGRMRRGLEEEQEGQERDGTAPAPTHHCARTRGWGSPGSLLQPSIAQPGWL